MKIFIPNQKAEDISKDILNSLIRNDEDVIQKLVYSSDIANYKQSYILIKGEPKTLVRKVY